MKILVALDPDHEPAEVYKVARGWLARKCVVDVLLLGDKDQGRTPNLKELGQSMLEGLPWEKRGRVRVRYGKAAAVLGSLAPHFDAILLAPLAARPGFQRLLRADPLRDLVEEANTTLVLLRVVR